jgi:hypothetical protein
MKEAFCLMVEEVPMKHKPSPMALCPSCSSRLRVSRLVCLECGLAVEGEFATGRLILLSPEQQRFVEIFVTSRGNIREVEQVLGISYPTVRKRLDEAIEALGTEAIESAEEANRRNEILSRIERGEISAKEAVKLLRES